MVRVVLVAPPGAGKSTTLQLLKKIVPSIKVANFGDYMFKIAKEKYGIEHRDEMRRKLSLDDYRKIQIEAAREISKIEGDVIIDTHAAVKMPTGYYPGLPLDVVKELNPDAIVLLEFDADVILERRLKDLLLSGEVSTELGTVRQQRVREIESEEEIELHQQVSRYFAAAAAMVTATPLYIISFRGAPQLTQFEHAIIGAIKLAKLLQKLGVKVEL